MWIGTAAINLGSDLTFPQTKVEIQLAHRDFMHEGGFQDHLSWELNVHSKNTLTDYLTLFSIFSFYDRK